VAVITQGYSKSMCCTERQYVFLDKLIELEKAEQSQSPFSTPLEESLRLKVCLPCLFKGVI